MADDSDIIDDYSTPFRVVILEDCRPAEDYGLHGNLNQVKGICLGQYLMPDDLSRIPDLTQRLSNEAASGLSHKPYRSFVVDDDFEEERFHRSYEVDDEHSGDVDVPSPLILSDKGDYIWGIQCYWAKSEDLKDIPEALWSSLPDAVRTMLSTHFPNN